jgi:hypothetical protein
MQDGTGLVMVVIDNDGDVRGLRMQTVELELYLQTSMILATGMRRRFPAQHCWV